MSLQSSLINTTVCRFFINKQRLKDGEMFLLNAWITLPILEKASGVLIFWYGTALFARVLALLWKKELSTVASVAWHISFLAKYFHFFRNCTTSEKWKLQNIVEHLFLFNTGHQINWCIWQSSFSNLPKLDGCLNCFSRDHKPSGVGGEGAGDASAPSKYLICWKFGQKWRPTFAEKQVKTIFSRSHQKTVHKSWKTTFWASLGKFGQKSFASPKICLQLHIWTRWIMKTRHSKYSFELNIQSDVRSKP